MLSKKIRVLLIFTQKSFRLNNIEFLLPTIYTGPVLTPLPSVLPLSPPCPPPVPPPRDGKRRLPLARDGKSAGRAGCGGGEAGGGGGGGRRAREAAPPLPVSRVSCCPRSQAEKTTKNRRGECTGSKAPTTTSAFSGGSVKVYRSVLLWCEYNNTLLLSLSCLGGLFF